MQYPNILKNISCPALSPTILHRKNLVTRLNEVIIGSKGSSHYKLVVLCAPAGYGKTTLLADFDHHTLFSCCWYFLDHTSVDGATFLKTLIRSIRCHFPEFGKTLDPLILNAIVANIDYPSQMSRLEAVIDALIAAIDSEITERWAIFLCNYHEVSNNQEVNHLVNRLLRKLPSHCVIVIESRTVPPLDFASLLARDETVGFDHTFLRFTTAEIQDLARHQNAQPLCEQEAEQLITLFNGWIAGILLGTRLGNMRILRSRKDMSPVLSLPNMHIDRQNLFAYLVNEVFSHDMQVYTFLKETSVLRQLTPNLCNTLLKRTDALDCLQYLEQQGLFVTCSGDEPQLTYTCHPLLRELFHDELRSQSKQRFIHLHQCAIEIWHAAGDYEEVIYHALEASLPDVAAGVIVKIHKQLFTQGRMKTLSLWIDALPTEIVAKFPEILLLRANIYLSISEYTNALPLLTKASEITRQEPPIVDADDLPLLQARISIAQSKALAQMGEYLQAQKLCQQVIEQAPLDEAALHAEAHMRLGACASMQGDFTASIAHLQKALQLWGRNSETHQTAELHSMLAYNYGLIGNFALAEHHHSCATRCFDHLHDDWGRVNNLLNMGAVKHRQGELTYAEALFQEALAIARRNTRFQRVEAYALVNLGGLYQDQECYGQALAVTEEGLALARQLQDRYLINCTLCILAMTYLFMGDAETAMLLVSEGSLEASSRETGGYEKARRELVRGTVFLYQRRYDKAHACLAELETYLRTIGLQWELLCTTLRLIECQLAQGHISEALQHIDEITALILRNDYEQLVSRELRMLPTLDRAIKTMPALACLRTQLQSGMLTKVEEIPEELSPAATAPTLDLVVANTPQLQILALGEPTIIIDAKPVTRWRMARALELFFLLLDSNCPLRKEQIIATLWPEADNSISQTLHSTIHYLRKSLGETCITSRSGTYQLNLASSYGNKVWYDVTAFQEHDAKAKEALGCKDDMEAQKELSAMLKLYRGDYVQSFYSDWCTFRRDKLRLAYLDAHQQLALIAWRGGQVDKSALHWQEILAVDSCLEEAHCGLIRCYLHQEKRGLALRQYQRCTEVLRNELGVKPSPTTQDLLQYLTKSS
jgi:LuxR family transcriptional regulator, maltose regulon positive regulatory protein